MNILFLTLAQFNSIQERGIYTDLLREFIRKGHYVCAISPVERRQHQNTHIIEEDNAKILRLRIGNTQKTNIIEKGISTVLIEPQLILAIKKYFANVRFDLVLYSTPPITLNGAVQYVKKRDDAKTYLLLKDIFPQNAVDIGMMSKTGIKGMIYKHFRRQEKILYAISDRIGCMSQANVDYVISHNSEVKRRNDKAIKNVGKPIVEICPNSIEPIDMSVSEEERIAIREKYNIPLDKKVFIYGGNLGKPQCIPFLIKCLRYCRKMNDVFFLVVGDGTDYGMLEKYMNKYRQENVKLMQYLPKDDYDKMVGACDVGMILLDHRFTIPNFPSRLLSYMQAKIPVLACTDPNTDIGNVITGIDKDGNKTHEPFGWWCESDDLGALIKNIQLAVNSDLEILGDNGFIYLKNNYDVKDSVSTILMNINYNLYD